MVHLLWVVLVEEYSHFGKDTRPHHLYVVTKQAVTSLNGGTTSFPDDTQVANNLVVVKPDNY